MFPLPRWRKGIIKTHGDIANEEAAALRLPSKSRIPAASSFAISVCVPIIPLRQRGRGNIRGRFDAFLADSRDQNQKVLPDEPQRRTTGEPTRVKVSIGSGKRGSSCDTDSRAWPINAGFQPAVSQCFQPAGLPYSRACPCFRAMPTGNRRYSSLEAALLGGKVNRPPGLISLARVIRAANSMFEL